MKFWRDLLRRLTSLTIISVLIMTLFSSIAYAKKDQITDKQIDSILQQAGVPQFLMNELDIGTKRFIVENSGDDLQYIGSSKQYFSRNIESGLLEEVDNVNPPGEMTTMAILDADLSLIPIHFNSTYNGVSMVDIYSSFEWLRNPKTGPDGINKDHIAIAVPNGWEIQSGRYACAAQKYDYSLNQGWHWSAPNSSWCGDNGQPTAFGGLYGAAWEFISQGSGDVATPFVKYKGTAKLTMKKVSSTAIKRILTSYNEASSSYWGNYSVTIGWGAASVTFTPTAGTADQKEEDYTWVN